MKKVRESDKKVVIKKKIGCQSSSRIFRNVQEI